MTIPQYTITMLLISGTLAGCSNSSSPNRQADTKQVKGSVPSGPTRSELADSEAEARAILKAALDSWAFGDTLEKFQKDHPGVQVFDTNWITKKRLGRYEIGNMRKDGMIYEFLVTLSFREDAGDITRSGDYHVIRDPKGWQLTASTR